MPIGNSIKNMRLACGLTQEELADRCELTKGYISQLENDLTSPSIDSLVEILAALGTNLKEFFGGYEEEEEFVFGKERFVEKKGPGRSFTWLVPNAQKNDMEPVLVRLDPGGGLDEDYSHESEEFGYVMQGEIALFIDNKKHVCKKGQSFYIGAQHSHRILNEKNRPAEFVWVSSPPNF